MVSMIASGRPAVPAAQPPRPAVPAAQPPRPAVPAAIILTT